MNHNNQKINYKINENGIVSSVSDGIASIINNLRNVNSGELVLWLWIIVSVIFYYYYSYSEPIILLAEEDAQIFFKDDTNIKSISSLKRRNRFDISIIKDIDRYHSDSYFQTVSNAYNQSYVSGNTLFRITNDYLQLQKYQLQGRPLILTNMQKFSFYRNGIHVINSISSRKKTCKELGLLKEFTTEKLGLISSNTEGFKEIEKKSLKTDIIFFFKSIVFKVFSNFYKFNDNFLIYTNVNKKNLEFLKNIREEWCDISLFFFGLTKKIDGRYVNHMNLFSSYHEPIELTPSGEFNDLIINNYIAQRFRFSEDSINLEFKIPIIDYNYFFNSTNYDITNAWYNEYNEISRYQFLMEDSNYNWNGLQLFQLTDGLIFQLDRQIEFLSEIEKDQSFFNLDRLNYNSYIKHLKKKINYASFETLYRLDMFFILNEDKEKYLKMLKEEIFSKDLQDLN